MRQKSNSTPVTSENLVRNIRRATRKHHAAEEKIRIVMLSAMPSRWHSSAIEVSPRRPSSIAGRDISPWGAQFGIAVCIESFEHFELADIGNVGLGWASAIRPRL